MPYQIHSADALVVNGALSPSGRDAMASRPRRRASRLASPAPTAAWCFSPTRRARVIGAAHAGWKGALDGVLEATLAAMETLGADRSATIAALGPAIGAEEL